MNKRILILAVIAALVIAYVIMKKETKPVQTSETMAVADVIAEDEMNGDEMPIPDAAEEVVVVDEEMPDPEEVAVVDEEVVSEKAASTPANGDVNNQQAPEPASAQ